MKYFVNYRPNWGLSMDGPYIKYVTSTVYEWTATKSGQFIFPHFRLLISERRWVEK